ncbi:ABC transporter ATP-binding protein [Phaeovulum sp.]|uniref:ABC transporter ATP-binding protein n=1 Tax=Phaeovulum sp. TaxID=2934796 RepID=UPI0027300F05|nr:ABC transporter ATP-binding protein [Phaeovulum sp.]MDP1670295.1 ABC transporter ATP-binding protein [Phaeovulum sp.]MDZ4120147.1 ABC transporter ATP-binding protein [Phaeovulum sp.]
MGETFAVEARDAVKVYGTGVNAITALDHVSVSVSRGEFFTLLGPSGCGKTTLLRCIAGFETPTSGAILLSGKDITEEPPYRRPVNTVFQSYALFPHLTVARNIGFGLEMMGKPKAEIAETVARMLALVRLEEFAARLPQQLSGGQQQRVALARALAPKPQVLLLDEPLSALDLKLRKEMQGELKRLQLETGITFVFVTHDQEEALTMSDRIGVMRAGKLQQVGTPRDIYDRPANRYVADFIGETNFLTGVVEGGAVRLGSGDLVRAVLGGQTGTVTLAVRPEQIRVVATNAPGAIPARITGKVYFGTDTHYHFALVDGTEVVARLQSRAQGEDDLPKGTEVGLQFEDSSVQVLGP